MSTKRHASAHYSDRSKRRQQSPLRHHEGSAMSRFRLYNLDTAQLEWWPLNDHPPYLAASHAWSEGVFAAGGPFSESFGVQGLIAVVRTRFTNIQHFWIDTFCIDQEDKADQLEQIPLMGLIFGTATCVVVFVNEYLNTDQVEVDLLAAELEGALAMCLDEAWTHEGGFWQHGEGRQWLLAGMKGLLRLANTAWTTRIWTLQEYVLARDVLWIGRDLVPISVDNYAISALPDICNTLYISECLNGDFKILSTHFAAMSNARAGNIDRTRIMELPGNRKASEPVDEVYGVMAASGVIIECAGETKESAWNRWCLQAVREQHIRWILLPVSARAVPDRISCIFPPFSIRHKLSAGSGLDSIHPLRPLGIDRGAVTTAARVVGILRIDNILGRVHEPQDGVIYRDITIVLFAAGSWNLALKLVWAFGGGRYSAGQTRLIARILVQSYALALRHVLAASEEKFVPVVMGDTRRHLWNDFMQMQQSQMIGLNDCVGYLSTVTFGRSLCMPVVANLAEAPPVGRLIVLDFGAKGLDQRSLLMVVQETPPNGKLDMPSFHKVGMTLPVSEQLDGLWRSIPATDIRVGGEDCAGCETARDVPDIALRSIPERLACDRAFPQRLARHQHLIMHRLRSARRLGLKECVARSGLDRRRADYALRYIASALTALVGTVGGRDCSARAGRDVRLS